MTFASSSDTLTLDPPNEWWELRTWKRGSMNQDDIVSRITSQGVQFIMDCIKGGYEDYDNPEYYGEAARREHTPGTAAACRNCHIIERAKRKSLEMQGFIRIKRQVGRITFILGDHTEIWYKKIGKNGKPGFRPSRQSSEYLKSSESTIWPETELPPEMVRWVAGYRSSSPADTEYELLVCGIEYSGEWWHVCLSETEVQELFPVPTPMPAPAATNEAIKKRVKVRKPKAEGE